MSIAKEAILAYKSKNYEKALSLFMRAGEIYGAHLFQANIKLCRAAIAGTASVVVDSPLSAAPNADLKNSLPDPQTVGSVSTHTTLSTPLATDYAIDSLAQFKGIKHLNSYAKADLPLVSFVMTSHNAVSTVENAIMSIVNQSYANVEVIVCDDRSTDGTWELLVELANRMPKALRVMRMDCNGGTYLAKNAAIAVSKGSIIMFQDSDDYSHPSRTAVQVAPLLGDSNLIASRTKYCRFNPETGRVLPVASSLSKYGLITLAVRREAFDEIGYFDAVRRAGDDEWFQRLQHLYGKNRIKQLDVALYLAELRSGSLVADMLTFNADGSVEQSSSKARKDYVKQFRARFDDTKKRRAWYKASFPAAPLRPVARYPDTIAAITAPELPVYASVCSIPKRVKQLENVVDRILPQVDRLYVYLDKYETTPEFLLANPKIVITHASEHPIDYRDNAKFLPYDQLKKEGNFYFVTCDDDLIYPFDYVRALISSIKFYQYKAIVGLHGVVYEEAADKYFRRRFVYHFKDQLKQSQLVNNLGTGTVAFHSSIFESLNPADWTTGGMVDIFFANHALMNHVPMVCIARHAGWLIENEMPDDNSTLFGEFKEKEVLIVNELKKGAPWGYKSILRVLDKQPQEIAHALNPSLPLFAELIKVSDIFPRLR